MLSRIELFSKIFDKVEFRFSKFVSLPNFVTKLSVRDYFIDIEINAPALNHVG